MFVRVLRCAKACVAEWYPSVPLGKIVCMSSVREVIPWGGHVRVADSSQ